MKLVGFRKSRPLLRRLTRTLSPAAFIIAHLLLSLPAQSLPDEWKVSVEFPPVPDRGAPGRTAGAGTRGALPLVALSPTNNIVTTVSGNPTLFAYIPKTRAQEAEFVVFDDAGNFVYREQLVLPEEAGIVKLSLPEEICLQVGKRYVWEVTTISDPENPDWNPSLRGWIQRTELDPNLEAQLENAEPLEKAELYAQAAVWSEAVSILAQLRDTYPEEWEELLNSVNLGRLIEAPLADCCTEEEIEQGMNGHNRGNVIR